MSLNIVGNYFSRKSIKLSDSFTVEINGEEYVSCTGFTLPKLEMKEELMVYGNTSQTFLIPNYESCKELTLEFYEEVNKKIENLLTNYSSYTISQNSNSKNLTKNIGVYTKKIIPNITINILNNNLSKIIYKYTFDKLKIINYTLYNLDYSSDSPCKMSITFSFENYTKSNVNIDLFKNKPSDHIGVNTDNTTIKNNNTILVSDFDDFDDFDIDEYNKKTNAINNKNKGLSRSPNNINNSSKINSTTHINDSEEIYKNNNK